MPVKLLIISIILLSFFGVLLATDSAETVKEPVTEKIVNDSSQNITTKDSTTIDDSTLHAEIIVYYFHGTHRCATCKKLEKYAREAVEKNFSKQIENGFLKFSAVNVDEKENKHFNEDYGLYTKALILSRVAGGKEISWKNLEKIWDLVGDESKYKAYVTNEINEFIGEKK